MAGGLRGGVGDAAGLRDGECRRGVSARRHRRRPAGRDDLYRHRLLKHHPGGALRLWNRPRRCGLPVGRRFRDGTGARIGARLRHRCGACRGAARVPPRLHVQGPQQLPGSGAAGGRAGGAVVRVGDVGGLCRSCRSGAAEAGALRAVRGCGHRCRTHPDRGHDHDLPEDDDGGTGREPDGTGVDGDGRARGGAGRAHDPRSCLALHRPGRDPHATGAGPGGMAGRKPAAAAARPRADQGEAEGPWHAIVASLRPPGAPKAADTPGSALRGTSRSVCERPAPAAIPRRPGGVRRWRAPCGRRRLS